MKKNMTIDKKGFINLLKLYNRYIYSVVNFDGCEKLPDEIITDKEIDFLFNLYQEFETTNSNKIKKNMEEIDGRKYL
jgi:hypothetical protein